MNNCFLKLQRLHPDAIIPTYANPGDFGMDLSAVEPVTIPSGQVQLIKTGWAVEWSNPNYCLQICSRSGLALKSGIFVLNSPGVVDFNYRGEIGVILANFGSEEYAVRKGGRIAQLLIVPVLRVSPSLFLS